MARTVEGLAPKPLAEQHLLGFFGLRKHFTTVKGTVPYGNVTGELHGIFTDTYLLWGQRGGYTYRVHCISEDPE